MRTAWRLGSRHLAIACVLAQVELCACSSDKTHTQETQDNAAGGSSASAASSADGNAQAHDAGLHTGSGGRQGSSPTDASMPDANAGRDGGSMPDANAGIATRYPGDQGITADPAVLFADDFEGYAQPHDLDQHWDAV